MLRNLKLLVAFLLVVSFTPFMSVNEVSANGDDGSFKEEGASFNPTEPEVQLGDITEVDIKESGAVILDSKSSQGIITGEKLIEIDGVQGKGLITYILDKESQDIISVHSTDSKIIGEDGSTVQINQVDELIGNNGVADKDGFKSNLVPEEIPKTGLPPTLMKAMPSYLFVIGLISITIFGVQLYFVTRKERDLEELNQ